MPTNKRITGPCSVCEREMLLATRNPARCHRCYEKKRQDEGKAPKDRERDRTAYYQANKERLKEKQKERYYRLKAEGKLPARTRTRKPRVEKVTVAELMAQREAYEQKREKLARSKPRCQYCGRIVLKDGLEIIADQAWHRVCMYAEEARRNISDRSRSSSRQDQ